MEFVKAAEVYELTTQGGTTDFARVIVLCERFGPYGDPRRRLSQRKKDELDLIRLAEKYPHLKARYPLDLQQQIDRG
jgi:hypothetical protein